MPAPLPRPSTEAQAHSDQLRDLIRNDIAAQGGWITFARYMELALYAPGMGYYPAGARKFGAAGDFVTAPEISSLFGRVVARQAAEIMAHSAPHLLELGAGSGKLALDMLGELERLNALPESYAILEVSADLRERQQALLREKLPHLKGRVHWLDALPETISGAVIGNEVLDALPVHLVHWRPLTPSRTSLNQTGNLAILSPSLDGITSDLPPSLWRLSRMVSSSTRGQGVGERGELRKHSAFTPTLTLPRQGGGNVLARLDDASILLKKCEELTRKGLTLSQGEGEPVLFERGVSCGGEGFAWQDRPIKNPSLLQAAQRISVPDGYVSEISLASRGLASSLCERLQQGALLFVDYGFGAGEYYHPQRNRGTLMCHYRHHAHDDPFFLPGLQDITAHVDFTAVAEAAIDAGAHLLGYTSQAFFLLNCGITGLLQDTAPENLRDYLPLSAQLQKLTSPSEMGERFKVMALGKGMDVPLLGFARGDLSRLL